MTDETRAEQAGRDAADPGRLLDGEDPSTPHADEARHWLNVYSELVTFKEQAMTTSEANKSAMRTSDAREEVEKTDMRVLEAERKRLRERLAFWERRHRQLSTK